MIILSGLYPRSRDSRFDHVYYVQKHIPLVESRWKSVGLEHIELLRGAPTPNDGLPSFELIVLLTFTSATALQEALTTYGDEVIEDIANFTDVQPLLQINYPVPLLKKRASLPADRPAKNIESTM